MMAFLSFLALLAIAYLLWRLIDQVTELAFRLSEVQRDVADMARRTTDAQSAEASSKGTD